MKKLNLKAKLLALLLTAVFLTLTACGNNTQATLSDAVPANAVSENETDSELLEQASNKDIKLDPENDTERGLLNIKTQDNSNFSDIEKLIIQYFDTDYFRSPNYDNLQRYPKVYKGAQICFLCTVEEIIKEENDTYTILVNYTPTDPTKGYAVIKGQTGDARLISGDMIYVYGQYTEINTYEYEGKSYKVPTIIVNRYTYANVGYALPLFSYKDIKMLAEYIFGDVIVSDLADTEYWVDAGGDYYQAYVVELENQSNANFTAYEFSAYEGNIWDLKSTDAEERTISFSADFDHFFVKYFNHTLSNFSLSCYDRNLKKIWTREFEDTTSASFDCTTNNIYLIANGYMYIINALTGEDVFEKKYVGQKTGIRKVDDGIILIAETQTEAIMKTDLKGNVLWTVDVDFDNRDNGSIQLVGDNIVYCYSFTHYAETDKNYVLYGDRAMVISSEGKVLESVKPPVENYTYIGPSTIEIPQKSFAGYYLTTDYLNVRSGPGTNYSIIKVLPPKSSVYVIDIQPDSTGNYWALLDSGAYVSTDYLTFVG